MPRGSQVRASFVQARALPILWMENWWRGRRGIGLGLLLGGEFGVVGRGYGDRAAGGRSAGEIRVGYERACFAWSDLVCFRSNWGWWLVRGG